MRSRRFLTALVTFGLTLGLLATAPAAIADGVPDANDIAETCRDEGGSVRTCKGIEALGEGAAHGCRYATDADANGTHETCAHIDGQDLDPVAIDAWETSTTAAALAWQRDLAAVRPLGLSQVIGTHNAFNSRAYEPTLSGLDANQLLSMTDQLRMGVRSLELDVHWIPSPHAAGNELILCHANDHHAGCTVESQTFADGLAEIRAFLDANPGEFVIIEIQNELHTLEQPDAAGHAAASATLDEFFPGSLLFRPSRPGGDPTTCDDIPVHLSIDEMQATGAIAVAFSGCTTAGAGHWNDTVFTNDPTRRQAGLGSSHYTDGAYNYTYATGCAGPFGPPDVTNWTRSWDDTTVVSAIVDADDWIVDAEIIGHWVDCGMNLPSLDDLAPADPRMAAFVWSWADGVEPSGDRARYDADGRWKPADLHDPTLDFAACLRDGEWHLQPIGRRSAGRPAHSLCPRGSTFSPPRTGHENQRLLDAASEVGVERVLFASR